MRWVILVVVIATAAGIDFFRNDGAYTLAAIGWLSHLVEWFNRTGTSLLHGS